MSFKLGSNEVWDISSSVLYINTGVYIHYHTAQTLRGAKRSKMQVGWALYGLMAGRRGVRANRLMQWPRRKLHSGIAVEETFQLRTKTGAFCEIRKSLSAFCTQVAKRGSL